MNWTTTLELSSRHCYWVSLYAFEQQLWNANILILFADEDNEPYKCLACGGRYDNLIGNLQGGGVSACMGCVNLV